ncbi:MAG: FixH family protein [Chitinophagaceae bacterium]|nr:FixH family protein [Chitinophagaceae bacterium]
MNWGHKLTIAIVIFVSWMAYMVYRCATTDFQLVEKDYYKNELRYQEVIDATARARQLGDQAIVSRQADKIVVQLPGEVKDKEIKGNLWFYCAYDEALDKRMSLQTNNDGMQVLDVKELKPGSYTVKIEWTCNNLSYFKEEQLTL